MQNIQFHHTVPSFADNVNGTPAVKLYGAHVPFPTTMSVAMPHSVLHAAEQYHVTVIQGTPSALPARRPPGTTVNHIPLTSILMLQYQ